MMMMMMMMTMMMRSTTTTTFALWLFLTTSTHALDLDVTQVSCQDDLPLTTSLTSQGGTFGESMDLEGSLTLNGLEAYMMQDDDGGGDNNEDNNEENNQNTQYNYLVYVNANIYGVVSDNLEYSLVDQQAWPLCDTIIATTTDDEDLVCPADGTYEYSTSFNLPSLPTDDSQFADWLASGWNGYIQLEMLSSNQEVVVGSCQISFVTSVTASDANTNKLAQSVSGKWGVFGILALVLLTALSCCYCICCRRRRRRQKTVEDVPETEFTRMPDTTTTSTNSTKTKPKGPPLTAGGGPAWTSV